MKKLFLLLVAVLTLSLCASAQTRTVKGTVVDAANDEPLIGVSVTAGTNYGESTTACQPTSTASSFCRCLLRLLISRFPMWVTKLPM